MNRVLYESSILLPYRHFTGYPTLPFIDRRGEGRGVEIGLWIIEWVRMDEYLDG